MRASADVMLNTSLFNLRWHCPEAPPLRLPRTLQVQACPSLVGPNIGLWAVSVRELDGRSADATTSLETAPLLYWRPRSSETPPGL